MSKEVKGWGKFGLPVFNKRMSILGLGGISKPTGLMWDKSQAVSPKESDEQKMISTQGS